MFLHFAAAMLIHFSLLLAFCTICYAAHDARLKTALTLDTPCTGVSTTPDGRLFVLYARVDGTQAKGLREVVEWKNGKGTPYPDVQWNSYTFGKDPTNHLIRVNSQRIGPDGQLWLVDTGSPGVGVPVILPQGPKLVVVNVTTNKVSRVYNMGNVILQNSLMDDIRFNPAAEKAYITDAGVPAVIVLDLKTGEARRYLENDLSTSAFTPVSAEGALLRNSGGKYQYIYADQLEVSPDAKWLYYQPASGGMSRIQTRYLDQAFTNSSLASLLHQFVESFALTPSTGGTAIDADGNIYNSDTDRFAIEKICPNGTRTTLIQDDRLLWIDAMWVDSQKRLWMPAAQLNRGVPFGDGTNRIEKPLHVYTLDIGVGPSRIDHA